MTEAFDKFKRLLDELFQFDRADLDFGIYRVMNSKRKEVSDFLSDELLPQVKHAFDKYQAGGEEQKRERMMEIERNAAEWNADPEHNEKYRQLKAELAESKSVAALEDEVYSDLYTFFRRYYKNGDFLSLRRYKEGTYAIPYEGEEVKLHWANADQYYVKTTESFQDYRFRLSDDRFVHFRLAAAGTEIDNNKAQNGKERRFVLREETPSEEVDGELNVYFEYRPHTDNQKTLNERALERVFEATVDDAWGKALRVPMSTQSNPQRTTLEKHLGDYTAKNSFDYFIHKDLGRFFRRELDFYLKNEVLHVDDLNVENADRAVQYLAKLGVIKQIGHKLIAFLAQIEDFQKKLFEKKKFVIQADYCLTLDNVPEDFYREIAGCDDQYAEWERLFAISEIEANLENGDAVESQHSVAWLKANPYLVLDTKFFSQDFKNRLLASMENLDEMTDGLLVNSENFQAINLIQQRYREQVKGIYIDPPYNTGGDGFLYKDSYQRSSWLSMMEDRLVIGREMLDGDGAIFISIDDNEQSNLKRLLDTVFGQNNFVAQSIWQRKYSPQNDAKSLSVLHEYIISYARSVEKWRPNLLMRTEENIARYKNPDNDPRGVWKNGDLTSKTKAAGHSYPIESPSGKVHYPPSGRQWAPSISTYERLLSDDRIWFGNKGSNVPALKQFLSEVQEGTVPTTLWLREEVGDNQEAARGISSMGFSFESPKPVRLVSHISKLATNATSTLLDFFAGSGTTGHAIIDLNRTDGGNRKYILVEMGEYFNTVLKPRIQKVIYSKDWKDGKPVSREGSSHVFKYLTLESYEDTLNNVALNRLPAQQELVESDDAVREEYMLSYMLDNEASGSPSLLNSKAFEEPFTHKLKVSDDNQTRLVDVDMVETFNYLLGLTVERVGFDDGFRTVEGQNPQGERVLVIWRNLGERSNADLDAFFARKGYGSRGEKEAFDLIYVNGDNNLENLKGKGERWRTLLIEEEFERSMFGSGGDFGSLVGAS